MEERLHERRGMKGEGKEELYCRQKENTLKPNTEVEKKQVSFFVERVNDAQHRRQSDT